MHLHAVCHLKSRSFQLLPFSQGRHCLGGTQLGKLAIQPKGEKIKQGEGAVCLEVQFFCLENG